MQDYAATMIMQVDGCRPASLGLGPVRTSSPDSSSRSILDRRIHLALLETAQPPRQPSPNEGKVVRSRAARHSRETFGHVVGPNLTCWINLLHRPAKAVEPSACVRSSDERLRSLC